MSGLTLAAPRGRAPEWWRSGERSWLWWTALVVTVAIQAAGAAANQISPVGTSFYSPAQDAFYVAAAAAEAVVALLFWMWRRGNAIGPLLLVYLNLIALTENSGIPAFFPHSAFLWTEDELLAFSFFGVYVWILFAFPSGRVWNRAAAGLAVFVWVFAVFWQLPYALFVGSPRTLLYVGHGWSGLGVYEKAYSVANMVVWAVVVCFMVVRVRRAAPGVRRRLVPLYALTGLLVTGWFVSFIDLSFTGSIDWGVPASTWWVNTSVLPLASAIGAAFGLSRVRSKRGEVAVLVLEVDNAEPGQVRESLARAVGDPSLVLGLWIPERRAWVDEDGAEVVIPRDGSRGVTYVGDRLAVLVHDRDLLDQPRLLEAAGSAARLALVNERLRAELRAQVEEVRASRSRLVTGADGERRRLERDLREGAQRRLAEQREGLVRLHGHLDDGGRSLLGEIEDELRKALSELRDLARGIHPAVLTELGLDAAVRSLAERAPVPVEVTDCGERLPEPVETAAYFVVSEALANVAKYAHASSAWVSLRRENGHALVEVRDDGVGGADPSGGSGLRGLADRVAVLDGRLTVRSPAGGGTLVAAEIPCPA